MDFVTHEPPDDGALCYRFIAFMTVGLYTPYLSLWLRHTNYQKSNWTPI